jgi:hypothetical protein
MGPTFKIGDIIGCGIIYPPLGKHCGKIFFTKNGGLVTMLDIGVGGLLGLPWFPVVVRGFVGFFFKYLLIRSFIIPFSDHSCSLTQNSLYVRLSCFFVLLLCVIMNRALHREFQRS